MGLLDQAIREHLELKRRNGANPQALAREVEEALQPLDPAEVPAWASSPAALEVSPEDLGQAHAGEAPAPFDAAVAHTFEAETQELDMASVLAEPDAAAAETPVGEAPHPEPFRARRIVPVDAPLALEEDLEWEEVPRRGHQEPALPEASPQETLAFE